MRVFIIPQLDGCLEAILGERIVPAFQSFGRGSQRGGCAVLQERHLCGEGPAVIRFAGVDSVHLVRAQFVGVNAAVSVRRGISQVCVLSQRGLDDTHDRMTEGLDLREHLEHPMLHLLHRIRNAVGAMHLNGSGRLVDGEIIPVQVELLVGEREILNHGVLARSDIVVVSGVKPTANVETGYVLPGLIG